MGTVRLQSEGHISVIFSLVGGVSPESHIPSAGHHRSVGEHVQTEGDVLVEKRETDKSPAQFGSSRGHIEAHYPVAHHTPYGAVSTHSVPVVEISHHGHVGKHIHRGAGADGAFVINSVCEG